jgi:diguanylate cyclase (GGDEF)-like protein/PAS domain S-box-containing protein
MNRSMIQYRELVRSTSEETSFGPLWETWRQYYNGLRVDFQGDQPIPGWPLLADQSHLGDLTVTLMDGLDAQAAAQRSAAAAVATRERATEHRTAIEVGLSLLIGLLLALAVATLAIRTETARRRAEQRFRALVQASADVIAVVGADGRFDYLSPSIEQVMGYQPAELAGRLFTDLLHPDEVGRATQLHAAQVGGDREQRQFEMRVRHADGSWRWHDIVVRNLLADPAVHGVVINHRDITERREFQDQLSYEASHDMLTGLANRGTFLASLERAVSEARAHGHLCAALFLDLNDFKQVNDTWGHEAGDGLLVGVADVLRRSLLGADIVARLGGDEFGIVLKHITAPDNAEAVARRIINALAEPIDTAGRRLRARASIGIAVSGPDTADADELLRQADAAMYLAKSQKINGWRTYADCVDSSVARPLITPEDLQRALSGRELRLQYQPIVALRTGQLLGVEALVRWQHPTLGYLNPLEFIPLAEASGLIDALGDWVLRVACRQVHQWRQGRNGALPLSLSVNISPRQLDDPTLPERVLQILAETGLQPTDLILEVTENALVNDAAAIPALTRLHERGIRIALDDFGTGYSSLRYLTNLPVDILKLDQCFVAELDGTPEGSAVAEAVIRLSQALNIEAIAEGVEQAAQATELTLLGCTLAQGYHFARPLDADVLTGLIDNGEPGGLLRLNSREPATPGPGPDWATAEDGSARRP